MCKSFTRCSTLQHQQSTNTLQELIQCAQPAFYKKHIESPRWHPSAGRHKHVLLLDLLLNPTCTPEVLLPSQHNTTQHTIAPPSIPLAQLTLSGVVAVDRAEVCQAKRPDLVRLREPLRLGHVGAQMAARLVLLQRLRVLVHLVQHHLVAVRVFLVQPVVEVHAAVVHEAVADVLLDHLPVLVHLARLDSHGYEERHAGVGERCHGSARLLNPRSMTRAMPGQHPPGDEAAASAGHAR
mmetsp:Transcript_9822/g.24268  ORF Transcript_9822/g.24268 Transcript_9822/m.24268 type:complete len:238 (+) Transcript_9822:174-887(+)